MPSTKSIAQLLEMEMVSIKYKQQQQQRKAQICKNSEAFFFFSSYARQKYM